MIEHNSSVTITVASQYDAKAWRNRIMASGILAALDCVEISERQFVDDMHVGYVTEIRVIVSFHNTERCVDFIDAVERGAL